MERKQDNIFESVSVVSCDFEANNNIQNDSNAIIAYLYDKDLLLSKEYFGQYGVITKIVLATKIDKVTKRKTNSDRSATGEDSTPYPFQRPTDHPTPSLQTSRQTNSHPS